MSLLSDGTKLIFLHIPKTAGTTIHNALFKKFPSDKICPERFRGLDRYTLGELDKFQYFSGHFTYKMIDRIPGKKFIFTCLRNPQDRITSLYYFWRRHSSAFIEARDLAGPRAARTANSLADFLLMDTPVPRNAIKNEICRVLAGNINTDTNDRYFEIFNKQRIYVSKFELISRAICALSKFDHILFAESLDTDVELLCRKLSIEYPGVLSRLNTRTEVRPHLEVLDIELPNESDKVILKSMTDLDQLVYEMAILKRLDIVRN